MDQQNFIQYIKDNYCDIEDPELAFPVDPVSGKRPLASEWSPDDLKRLQPRILSKKDYFKFLKRVAETFGQPAADLLSVNFAGGKSIGGFFLDGSNFNSLYQNLKNSICLHEEYIKKVTQIMDTVKTAPKDSMLTIITENGSIKASSNNVKALKHSLSVNGDLIGYDIINSVKID